MLKRIVWLVTLLLLVSATFLEAQQAAKIPKIGFLIVPSRSFFTARMEGFQQGLRNLGYVEGKNILIEYRYAEGRGDRLPELAAELVNLRVDLIITTGPALWAAKNATKTIPIVFTGVQDPVATGVVDSLAKPGGNVIGFKYSRTGARRKETRAA